ncbi:hypothetical protein NS303_21070 [Pantoea ananatis]|jgi:hypothetical protein|uniref:Uncharacterized protein n=1 Tax=Pantoea ananas TaxID=553 RepID=A0AAJ1D1Z4_PANAN|nr:hypothetical protein [Pantoea ananatis]KTR46159.1 hypothetical protein NS303_21070 [Pantoea ananatis]KTR51542.1 hypothetical protein NS311_21295 [Pantoea ananatis]KTR63517.1 hypothetical protein RSA47_17170 [Pantoea ananatis]KTR69491.1 hypothetical protein NS296_14770 [Pantoea ananatis]MCW0306078.1 hypothetical protein [Pantoea ananatis]
MTPRNLVRSGFCFLFLLLFTTGLHSSSVVLLQRALSVQERSVIATIYRPVKQINRHERTVQTPFWEAVTTNALACRGGRVTRLLYKATLRRLKDA